MSARSKARKRALDIIFEADSKGIPIPSVLAEHVHRRAAGGDLELNEYAVTLATGVAENLTEIDALIAAHSTGWSVERMPDVDRAIARIGTFELRFSKEVPKEVAIAEAVNLATDLSTESSPAFINGLLAAVDRLAGT